MSDGGRRYYIGVGFAALVFFASFYGLVLYEFTLNDITQGFLISVGTLSAQFVFGEALAHGVGRRAQQSFEQGAKQGGVSVTDSGPTTVEHPTIVEHEPIARG